MKIGVVTLFLCGVACVAAQYDDSPAPPRLVIPGAAPAPGGRPQFRPQRVQLAGRSISPSSALPPSNNVIRVRRPPAGGRPGRLPLQQQAYQTTQEEDYPPLRSTQSLPPSPPTPPPLPAALAAQARPVPVEINTLPPRPVVEESDEEEYEDVETGPSSPGPSPKPSSATPFPRPGPTSAVFAPQRPQNLQPAVFRPIRPAFRPERPLQVSTGRPPVAEADFPVPTRQQFRQQQVSTGRPPVTEEDLPVPTRQQFRQQQVSTGRPPVTEEDFPVPTRQQFRQQQVSTGRPPVTAEDLPVPTRQQFRQQQARPSPPPAEPQYVRQQQPQQQFNRQQQQAVRQPQADYQDRAQRPKKPVAQVINKYRDDNPDGSITWGFENDDGTFKEETIGVDCVVKGKYGYIDPDGLKREYSYSSGIPCDRAADQEEKGFIDYQENKYVLPNGDTIPLDQMFKNKARKPVANNFRN